jgi:RNA recognition motif-containing protein
MIKNKQVEVKPAKSRENKKVFVGGLPADHPEDELRQHFEQYGKVSIVIIDNRNLVLFRWKTSNGRLISKPKRDATLPSLYSKKKKRPIVHLAIRNKCSDRAK